MVRTLAVIVLSAFLWSAGAAMAAQPGQAVNLDREIERIEHRFFFHHYEHDPLEKRLQRLELLIFGETQGGSNEERYSRLKEAIARRDRKSSKAFSKQESQPDPESRDAGGGSAQYGILNTLEWRALKKTYRKNSLDERLARLETKLFGQPALAMSYADRVDRLKKVLGIGVSRNIPRGPTGPRPKARPRSEMPPTASPFLNPWQPPSSPAPAPPWRGQPGFGPPFSMNPGLGQMNKQFNELFQELDRQMDQMMQMPEGSWRWDSRSGKWQQIKPPGEEKSQPAPEYHPFSMPKMPERPKLPPYYDPNTI